MQYKPKQKPINRILKQLSVVASILRIQNPEVTKGKLFAITFLRLKKNIRQNKDKQRYEGNVCHMKD